MLFDYRLCELRFLGELSMSYTYGTGSNANYSGRPLVYPDQVPFDTDVLREAQYRMVDVANLAQTILGLPSTFGGSYPSLSSGICTQNGAGDLTVNIGVCSIYSLQQMEPIAYGNLGPLTTPLIFKQFINMIGFSSSTLGSITAPATVGYSQYYLIQGTPNTEQINSVNRPYYNSANPASPNFNSADDTEIDNITFALVAGVASATPTIPTPTGSGIGMFVILVTHGQTAILNANISPYPGSFISTPLPQIPLAVLNNQFNYSADTGTVNSLIATVSPNVLSYATGMTVYVNAANTNTGAATLNVNGIASKSIVLPNGEALVGGEIQDGMICILSYNGTEFELLNPFTAAYEPEISILTGSGTYTTPTDAVYLVVEGWGDGGGGGGATAASSASAGGGGGAGGYFKKTILSPSATYAYSVGAGGAGASAGNNAGTGGSGTTFGGLTANGGTGGNGSAASSGPQIMNAPVAGGTASGGDINIQGGFGQSGFVAAAGSALSGFGGASPNGAGGAIPVTTQANGNVGYTPGGGGSGGVSLNNGGTQAGGNGGAGKIIVTAYF